MVRGGNEHIRKDSDDCLFIYQVLLEGHDRIKRQIHPYLNLIAIFFHDLIQILTNYILKVNEVRRFGNEIEFHSFPKNRDFPSYIDYTDIIGNINYEGKNYKKQACGTFQYRCIIQCLNLFNRLKSKERPKVGIASGVALRTSFRTDVFYAAPYISLPNKAEQIKIIFDCIDRIWERFHINSSPLNIKKLIERHIALYIRGNKKNIHIDLGIYVTQPHTQIVSRIISALCRTEGIPVVNILHGDGASELLDEPVFGYGERGFASIVLGYGKQGSDLEKTTHFVKPLYDAPRYIHSNSDKIKRIHTTSEIEPIKSWERLKIMYVPTSFSGIRYRYGPFRDISDMLYLQWQERLVNAFPEIIWKGHSKEHAMPDLLPHNARYILREGFEHCLHRADIFFFDYVSSAFAIACATNKPIVYFDIGLRNLTPSAYELMRKRCLVIPVDPESPGDLREQVRRLQGQSFINDITHQFSLYDKVNASREDILYSLIIQTLTGFIGTDEPREQTAIRTVGETLR